MTQAVDPADQASKVLLVDDHAVLVQALALVLQSEGLDVDVASDFSADRILSVAAQTHPDVVVLDLYLAPRVTSLPLIAPLAKAGARVLVLTSSEQPELMAACLEAGAAAVLPKSEPLRASVDAVLAALAGEDVRARQNADLMAVGRRAYADRSRLLAPFRRLTLREQEVLAAIMAGKSAEEIAQHDGSSIRTIRSHLQAIRTKLGVRSQIAAIALAREAGWTPQSPAT